MIVVVISTSSSKVSVALFQGEAAIGNAAETAPRAASGAALRLLRKLLEENGLTVRDIDLFVADVGPGSFTGVKVGVTLAKTFAFALGKKCAGISAFDLIGQVPVAIPARKGHYFLKTSTIEIVPEDDPRIKSAAGYGPAFCGREQFPDASRAADFIGKLDAVSAEELLPNYILEPSISQPKIPYKERVLE